jgi:hypothetical protein
MSDHMKCKCGREDGPTPAISSLGPYQIVCVVCGRAAPFGDSVDAAWATWNVDRAPGPAIEKARAALTLAKEGWDKTGEERVVPFLLRRIDEASALLEREEA